MLLDTALAQGLQWLMDAMRLQPQKPLQIRTPKASSRAGAGLDLPSGDARDLYVDRRGGWILSTLILVWTLSAMSSSACAMSDPSPLAKETKMEEEYAGLREKMVVEQLEARDITQPEVLAAMRRVPRHEFVPEDYRAQSYEDHPLPISLNQTISQPYIVALMTQLLALDSTDRVLEVGTGSGYHAAVLSQIAGEVYSIEIIEELGQQAKKRLNRLGFDRVELRIGDGYQGWAEKGPFDAIILTAAPREIPRPLLKQLRVGGRMIVPVGDSVQVLELWTRTEQGYSSQRITAVRFVPMTGQAQAQAQAQGD